jgi:hypothetical protein
MGDSMDDMKLHALLMRMMGTSSPSLYSTPAPEVPPPIETIVKEKPKEQKHCCTCKKKLMLSDMTCSKCQNRHCMQHRQPELHACPHDFKAEGQAILAKQNPIVTACKLEKL